MEPISPKSRTRGFGGSGILWRKSLDPFATKLSDGCERICAIKIDCEDISIGIISAYMPTNNGNHSNDLYRKCLDELSEIVAKYDFCNIVLAGDLNASFIRPKPTVRDKLFMKDIVKMGFVLPDKYPRDRTFHHVNGYSVSQIDYMLPFKQCDFITDIKIHHR